MMCPMTNSDRAEILVQALPYIKRYAGQVVVVKYGGNAMVSEDLKAQVMDDIVLLHLIGVRVVLVHGGGPDMTDLMQRLGKQPRFEGGVRVTDAETVDIALMVLAGKINKSLVWQLEVKGAPAMGVCGLDGGIIRAVQKDPSLGFVGEVETVNAAPLTTLLDDGYIPVVSTVGGDAQGNVYNINGDTAAARIAGALNAERLILMTDINGIRRDVDDKDSIIDELSVAEARQLQASGALSGGMIPKVECCIDAIEHGVRNVVILDGRRPHSLLMELLTDEGSGTLIN